MLGIIGGVLETLEAVGRPLGFGSLVFFSVLFFLASGGLVSFGWGFGSFWWLQQLPGFRFLGRRVWSFDLRCRAGPSEKKEREKPKKDLFETPEGDLRMRNTLFLGLIPHPFQASFFPKTSRVLRRFSRKKDLWKE